MVAFFVDYLIQKEVLEEEEREDSIYGLTLLMEKVIACVLLISIAVLVGKPISGIIFIVSFMTLRQMTGGYHVESFIGCLVGSAFTLFIALEAAAPMMQKHTWGLMTFFLPACACIWWYAPVNHPNLCLSVEEQREYKRWSRYGLALECVLIGLGYLLRMRWQRRPVLWQTGPDRKQRPVFRWEKSARRSWPESSAHRTASELCASAQN